MSSAANTANAANVRVFYTMLVERNVDGDVLQNAMDIAGVCALAGCARIPQGYTRTDMARNYIVKTFLKHAPTDDCVLVMLDNDHKMPRDVVVRLAQQVDAAHQVVGALAFRRSEPYDPCYFVRNAPGAESAFDIPTSFDQKLEPCMCVGTGAIAIRRSVFTTLDAAGFGWPYFRYVYAEGQDVQRSEDFEFGRICEAAGISHWVDTSFHIPHQTKRYIGWQDWMDFLRSAANEPDRVNAQFSRLGFSIRVGADGDGLKPQHAAE